MMRDLRRRYPVLLVLLAGALLALGSFWMLEQSRRTDESATTTAVRSEPDYYVENFSFLKVAANGMAEYVIDGKRMVHYPVDDSTAIEKPFLKSYSALRAPMTLRAERAKTNGDHSEVHLYEQVRLNRPETRGSETLTVESDYMLVLPDADLVKSDQRVVMKLGETILIGTGMVADNANHQLTLQSRVSGVYPPSARR